MWYVYVLKSQKKRWYYVGSTNNLYRRIHEHNCGHVRSTKFYGPFDLAYSIKFQSEKEARAYEKKIKKKRIEKEALIHRIESG